MNTLRASDVDMIERAPYEWVEQIKSGKIKGLTTVEAPYAAYHQLVFNVAVPPFNNKKFRVRLRRQASRHQADFDQNQRRGSGNPGYVRVALL